MSKMYVELTRPCRTNQTGVILPQGSQGMVVEVAKRGEEFILEFPGLVNVIHVPVDSDLIKVRTRETAK